MLTRESNVEHMGDRRPHYRYLTFAIVSPTGRENLSTALNQRCHFCTRGGAFTFLGRHRPQEHFKECI